MVMKKVPRPWKILSTKTLFEHGNLHVMEDTVELQNGKQSTYVYNLSETDSVIIIAINSHGDLLVQREYSHPTHKVLWQLPGGSMQKGEEIITAAQRELSEESGYASHTSKVLGFFYTNNRRTSKKQHVVLCHDLYEHKLQEDEDEVIESTWITIKNVRQMITDGKIENINMLAALNLWFHMSDS